MEARKKNDIGKKPAASSAVRPPISPAAMRIMRLLAAETSLTIDAIADKIGVTRTAVKDQLNELIACGYIAQDQERCGVRGRPCFLFSATDLSMRQLYDGDQHLVVPAIWRSLRRHADDELIERVCQDVAEELAAFYGERISGKTPRNRMKEFVAFLVRCDRPIEYEETGNHVEIRKFNCPFISMADNTGILCYIDRLSMQLIAGIDLRLIRGRNEGKSCCVFLLDLNPSTNSDYVDLGAGI